MDHQIFFSFSRNLHEPKHFIEIISQQILKRMLSDVNVYEKKCTKFLDEEKLVPKFSIC